MTVLAVADGHGAEKYRFSDRGARLAVESALLAAYPFHEEILSLEEQGQDIHPDQIRQAFQTRYLKEVIALWKQRVKEDAALREEGPPEEDERIKPYGTTLTVTILYDAWVFMAALGDSSVHLVRQNPIGLAGVSSPTPDHLTVGGEDAFSNVTDSLTSSLPHRRWKTHVSHLEQEHLLMVAAVSDGITRATQDFEKALLQILEVTQRKGIGWLQEKFLADLLNYWTTEGSADDVTFVAVFPKDLVDWDPAKTGRKTKEVDHAQ